MTTESIKFNQIFDQKSIQNTKGLIAENTNTKELLAEQQPVKGIAFFDITQLHPTCKGFSGIAFDGRYFYLSPLNNGTIVAQVVRYDTTLPFDNTNKDASSWSFFEITKINPESRGFVDILFDGRYVYLIPFYQNQGKHHGLVTRYDTTLPFDDSDSWHFFDTTTVHPNSRGFVSGCFDGTYIYMSPYQLDLTTTNGQVTRYNTKSNTHESFTNHDSWEVFETRILHPDSKGFHGAINHGQYIYFAPYLRFGKEYNGRLARYNKHGDFTDPKSWQSIDLTQFNSRAKGFVGGTSEGKYIYLAPYFDGNDRYGQIARYNTESNIEESTSWEFFDTATVDSGSRGFFGAISDGKFIYFLPHCRGIGAYHGQITRYDTQNETGFKDPSNWTICDTIRVHPDSRGFMGGIIHNGYLYMAPFEVDAGEHRGVMVRLKLDCSDLWLSSNFVDN